MAKHQSRAEHIPLPSTPGWRHEYVLKADFFSRSDKGAFDVDGKAVPAVRRDAGFAP